MLSDLYNETTKFYFIVKSIALSDIKVLKIIKFSPRLIRRCDLCTQFRVYK